MGLEQNLTDLTTAMNSLSIIKVIGVGGGGGNAVNHMFRKGIADVTFVVCNTDDQALKRSPVSRQILLGEGLGAGGRPEVARQAVEESLPKIEQMLRDNTKMVFITAGMGGGTGTGAAPVIAKVAHDMGILTVGIVTIPFAFEGKRKIEQALEGVKQMSKHVDAILVVNNEKLRQIYPDLELSNAFAKADDVLAEAAKGIAEIITVDGYINVDFADVNTIMKDGGVAIMNTGYAEGENRITNAILDALHSPLLNNNDIHDSKKILLNIYCSTTNEIRMEEIEEINAFMAKMGEDIEVIWGATFDDNLGDGVKITLIATGFNSSAIPDYVKDEEQAELELQPEVETKTPKPWETKPVTAKEQWRHELYPETKPATGNVQSATLFDLDDDDVLDYLENEPAYLRNKNN
ncbi:MAG TPA: cell division protein FtsZ [Paludibacteraceae bacterium]|nr:cell division protein FtsZ [Paludibacteraceae bacterium]